MKYYFLASLFIIILLPVRLLPQSFHFTNYTTKDGLSNNKVNAIIQDKHGFIWIGTEDGLNRYDGYEFKIYRNIPGDSLSLSDNNIWAIFEDTSGNIWIGTNTGYLNKFDQNKNIFYKWQLKSKSSNEVEITSILQDKEGSMWIGTYQDGLYRLNISTGKIQHWSYNPEDVNSLSNNFVTSILEDSSGSIWISTYNGLNRINQNSKENFFEKFYNDPSDSKSIPANLVWNVSQSKLNSKIIWIGTANGLSSFDIGKEEFTNFQIKSEKSYQFGNSIASIIEEVINNDTIIWLGTYAGLVRINKRTNHTDRFMKNETQPGSIVSNRINDIIKDRSGVIWIATENGISKLSSKSVRFNNVFANGADEKLFIELYGKSVKAVTKVKTGKIIFGTGSGIISFDPGKDNLILKYPQTEKLNVWSLESDKQGNLWIGTYGQGLKYFNLHSGKIKGFKIESPTFKTSAFDYIKSLLLDDDYLWIGFWGGGLARLDTKSGKYKIWIKDANDPLSISFNDVWSIINDKKNRIWIGTNGGGLNLFCNSDEGKFYKPLSENLRLSSNSIYALCEAKNYVHSKNENQTIIWIGTSRGLDKLKVSGNSDNQDFSSLKFDVMNFSTGNKTMDNSIKNILEDKNGNLWLSSGSGILFFDVKNEKFINYSEADGITGNEFNSEASIISNDGIMYFGSIGGINFFDPEQISLSSFKPSLLITDFQIFNQPVNIGENSVLKTGINNTEMIELAYSQNVFSFQLAALDFNYPQSIQYAYQMEGFDKDWIYSGSRRFMTYTNLASGKYVFKFKATNSDGVWNENYNSIIVDIDPPWWRTTWSYVLYFLLVIAGVFTLRKFETNRAKLRNELKMREFEAKKQRELETMKSRFFANLSHEFRTPLTLIRGPIEELINGKGGDHPEEYYDLIHRSSEKLQVLIDQLLELTRLENAAIPLKAKKEDLVKLLRGMLSSFESLAKQKNINLSFHSKESSVVCWIDRDKLDKIINNLISNAIKFTSENGIISININKLKSSSVDFAEVKITDSGIGIPEDKLDKIFDRFYQVDDSSRKNFGGSGIGLALVKELVDLHKWEIDVKSKEGTGTEFILIIPLGESHLTENEKESELVFNETIEEDVIIKKLSDEQIELNENEIEQEIIEKNKLLSGKPKILIVEDSEDVRKYLKGLLKNNYQISEAVNGEDGLLKSAELLPDLIISDVMMPSMDGIEFCKRIKTDIQTSHIPVILLTAKASQESRIEGFETGADAYIAKPFSFNELEVRIRNLIEQRKNLREKFSKEIRIDSTAVTVNSLDNEFLQKAFDAAEKNLSNSEFNSEEFAKEMFLSRSQFHRKLVAITGQGPGEFLRTFRLKKAATMILEKRLSVTQIAFEVGFNSPSHFTKAFQKQFNCLPSEFTRNPG